MRISVLAALATVLAWSVLACTSALLATPSGETQIGTDEAAQVEKQIGLVHAPVLEEYVSAIGKRLIEHTSDVRTDVSYKIQIVDMVEPNAFALPGGFVYISRGLLPLLNSEDELASVIGHEIGHVSARHHLRHSLREAPFFPVRLAAGIGGVATGLISPGLGKLVGAIGEAPGSLYLASHSRGQEDEADAIGQKLVANAGWDPNAMTGVMDALSREAALEGHDPNRRSFLDTHPTTPSRSKRTHERAATLKVAAIAPIAPDQRRFFEKLDGLLFGDPAASGVVVKNEFLHPDLDVRVAFPDGWKVHNGESAVLAAPEAGDALAALAIAEKGDDPIAVARRVVERSSLKVENRVESATIGGLPAARATASSREGWTTTYRHVVAWVSHGGTIYQVSGTALEDDWPGYRAALTEVVESFRPLSAADHQRVREARVRVVDARPGESLANLLARSDSAWNADRAAAANGLAADRTALKSGQPVKVARWEIYRRGSSER